MGKDKRPVRRSTNRAGLQEFLQKFDTQKPDQQQVNAVDTANTSFDNFNPTEEKKVLPDSFFQKPDHGETFDNFLQPTTIESTDTPQRTPKPNEVQNWTPEQEKLINYGNTIKGLRDELSLRMKTLDKGNKDEVASFNELVSKLEETQNRLKADFPVFNLSPDVVEHFFNNQIITGRNKNTSISEATPENWTNLGFDSPFDNMGGLDDKQKANNYQLLVKSLNSNLPISEIEKEGSIWGTQGGRIAGSFIQGLATIPDGFMAFGEMVSDEVGLPQLKQTFAPQAMQLREMIEGISPRDPNFVEGLSSGLGSMIGFMVPGAIAANSGKIAGLTPKIAKWLGIGTSAMLESVTEAGNVYRESGDSDAAMKTLFANLILVSVTNRFGVQSEDEIALLKKTLMSVSNEGLQEGLQEIISNASQGKEIPWNNVFESAAIGSIIGGGTTLATENSGVVTSPTTSPQQSPVSSPLAGDNIPGDVQETLTVDPSQVNPETGFTNFQFEDKTNDKETPGTSPQTKKTSTQETPQTEKVEGKKKKTVEKPVEVAEDKKTEPTDEEIISDLEDENLADDIETEVNEAATSPKNDLPQPTEAQKEAGNYKKGHIKLAGFDISIENPKDSKRSGIDPDGKKWSQKMKDHYGYFTRGTENKDGKLDVFVNPEIKGEPETAFVVDQVDPKTKDFDEMKVMLGYDNIDDAKAAYLRNYEKNWNGLGNITEVNSLDDLRDLVSEGDITKPFNYEKPVPVQKQTEKPKEKEQKPAAIEIKKNEEKEGIEIYFNDTKPSQQAIDFMKQLGMRWKRGTKYWYAKYSLLRESELNRYFNQKPTEKQQEPVKSGKQIFSFKNDRGFFQELKTLNFKRNARDKKFYIDKIEDHPAGQILTKELFRESKFALTESEYNRLAAYVEKTYDLKFNLVKEFVPETTKPEPIVEEKPIGKNKYGEDLYEDKRGVRYKLAGEKKNIKVSEPVSMIPGKSGVDYSTDRTDEDFLTTEELKKKAETIDYKAVVEKVGLIFNGIQKTKTEMGDLVTWTDPDTKSTHLLPVNEFNEESLIKQRDKYREEWNSAQVKPVEKNPKIKAARQKIQSKIKSIENDELKNLMDDFIDEMDKLPALINPQQLAKGMVLVEKYAELKVYKFADIVLDMYSKVGDKIENYIDAIKQAYAAYRINAPKNIRELMDGDNIIDLDFEKIISQVSPEKGSEKQNDTTNDGKGSDRNAERTESATAQTVKANESATDMGTGKIEQPEPELQSDTTGQSQNEQPGSEGIRTRRASKLNSNNYRLKAGELNESNFSFKQRFDDNYAAIETLKQLEKSGKNASKKQQEILSKYVGWGGLSQAFKEYGQYSELNEKLKTLLTEAEYTSAAASTINAHYTSPTVINQIWKSVQKLGFEGGKILEPGMGVGNFFGLIPNSISENSQLHGIELDDLTSRIASKLYPDAIINSNESKGMGYQEIFIPSNSFDLVIGNVPFADIKIYDESEPQAWWSKSKQSLHNFFIAKSMDKLKPGGIMAVITSHFTMDSINPEFRMKMSEQSDLVAAYKLPNNTFKGNANTEVTTDLLIFRKKDIDNPYTGKADNWINTTEMRTNNNQKVKINQYFETNPEKILGTLSASSSMYGGIDLTVLPGEPIEDLFRKALNKLPKNLFTSKVDAAEIRKSRVKNVVDDMKRKLPGVITVKDGKVYEVTNEGELKELTGFKKEVEKYKAMDELRNNLFTLYEEQLKTPDDARIQYLVDKYAEQYDKFVAKHGQLNSPGNLKAFGSDPDYGRLRALEIYNSETKKYEKSGLLKGRVFRPMSEPESFKNVKEAFAFVQGKYGNLDIDEISRLTKLDKSEVIKELEEANLVFQDLNDNFIPADEYLSGEVVKKLMDAEIAAKVNSKYERNVKALQEVQPKRIIFSDIEVKLGANFVDPEVLTRFVQSIMKSNAKIKFKWIKSGETSFWEMGADENGFEQSTANKTTYGTSRFYGIDLIEKIINNSPIMVYDTDPITRNRIFNATETALAQEKAETIKEKWTEYLKSSPPDQQLIEDGYNAIMNTSARRKFDGSHLTMPGAANIVNGMDYNFRPYQKNAIWRNIQNKFNLLDHPVGSGKTGTLVATIMERKRLGLTNKALYVTKKPLVEQVRSEAQSLYPNARILKPEKSDFEKKNKSAFLNRIKTNDWDFVVLSIQQFKSLALSPELEVEFASNQLSELEIALAAANEEAGNGNTRFKTPTQKELEKKKQRLLEKIRERRAKIEATRKSTKGKIDYFDQLGFDYLVVDEAHNYKNLYAPTSRQRVKGIGNTESQQAYDMMSKLWWVGKQERMGTVFATGTPVSNALTEFYIMQRYLQPNRLKDKNVYSLDDWLDIFTEAQTRLEITPEGVGMRPSTRVSKLVNLPELMKLYSEVTDIVSKEEVQKHLVLPKLVGGKAENVEVEASQEQIDYYLHLSERAQILKKLGGKADKRIDNFLKITTEGRKASLDIRLVKPDAEDNPNSKVNVAVNKIYEIWKETTKNKGTQVVFMDLGTPASEEMNLYADMKKKLVKAGIPQKEIAFAHDAKSDKDLSKLYKDVNDGNIRVIFGSTAKMSEGVNIQRRLYALHHMDPTYKPSELEQREGRIIRFGNTNEYIRIIRYITKGVGNVSGFDAYMYQLLENKIKGISQASNPDTTVRSLEEADGRALTYAEIKALATGNPLIMEKIQLDSDVERLSRLRQAHQQQMQNLQWNLERYPRNISKQREKIAEIKQVLDLADNEKPIEIIDPTKKNKVFSFDPVNDKERKLAGEELTRIIDYLKENAEDNQKITVLTQGGMTFDIVKRKVTTKVLDTKTTINTINLYVYPKDLEKITKSEDFQRNQDYIDVFSPSVVPGLNLNRLLNYNVGLERLIKESESEIKSWETELSTIKDEIVPFAKESEYIEKYNRLKEVNKLLAVKEAEQESKPDEAEETDAEDEDIATIKPKLYQKLMEMDHIEKGDIQNIADETGKSIQSIQEVFRDLKTKRLVILEDHVLKFTDEFKTLLSDINENPEKYEDDYGYLYSNPLPVMLKGLGKIQKVVDDLWSKTVGEKIYKGLGKGILKLTPEKMKELLITNYGLPGEYVTLKREAMDAIERYKELAQQIAENLKYSDVKNKVKFTEAEQMRLSQIIKGGITNIPIMQQRAAMAISEIKELEKLGRELETLPIETYNTKLSRARINELLQEKRGFEKDKQKILDKFGDPEEWDADEKKAVKRATAKLNEKIDALDKKIKDSYLHGNEGYLKRVYLSKEQEKRLSKYGITRPTRLDLTSAIHRKDIPFEVRKELGEILTAAYPAAKGIMLEGKDVSLGNFFKVISENPDWSSETEIIGWKQLPKDRKLGKLSELWVEPHIYNDINDVLKFTDQDNLESFMKQINATWKATKTIMNPSTHFRNIYSNSIMLDFSGVSHIDQVRVLPEAIKAVKGSGKYAAEFKASRLNNTTFNQAELNQYLDLVQENQGEGFLGMRGLSFPDKVLKLYGTVTLVDTPVGELLGKVYQYEEVLGKAVKFIAERESGKTILEARNQANKWLFDYTDVPSMIRRLRTNPVFGVPFVTWSYKAFPRILEAAITRPLSFWKYPVIFSALMKYALKQFDFDDDDWEKVIADFPNRMIKGEWLLLPFRDENGKMQMLDLTYILPYKDVYDVVMSGYTLATQGKFNNDDDIVDGLLGLFQAPILKTAAELIANKNTYSNTQIWLDVDSPREKLVKVFDYMYKTFMPSLAPEIPFASEGGYAYHKLRSVISGRDDYFGRTFGFVPAVASTFFGLKTSPIEMEKNIDRKLYKLQDYLIQLAEKRNKVLKDETVSEQTRLERSLDIDQQADELRLQIQNLNIPVRNPEINETESAIKSLQKQLSSIPIEKNDLRREMNVKINKLKIQLNNLMARPDAYTGEYEEKDTRDKKENRRTLTRSSNRSLSKSLTR